MRTRILLVGYYLQLCWSMLEALCLSLQSWWLTVHPFVCLWENKSVQQQGSHFKLTTRCDVFKMSMRFDLIEILLFFFYSYVIQFG